MMMMTTTMKLKHLVLAGVLTLGGVAAHAVNVVKTVDLIGSPATGYTAGLSGPSGSSINHTVSDTFTDQITFNYSGAAIVDVWLDTSVTLNNLATQQIVFTSATLNGMALTIDPSTTSGNTRFSTAGLFQTPANGSFVLSVTGYAGLSGSVGQTISASYSGGINVMPTAVPEPESYALMLAGLGAIGFIARRRGAR